jgi:hypothetical protein
MDVRQEMSKRQGREMELSKATRKMLNRVAIWSSKKRKRAEA